jgi:hypothetical protein
MGHESVSAVKRQPAKHGWRADSAIAKIEDQQTTRFAIRGKQHAGVLLKGLKPAAAGFEK